MNLQPILIVVGTRAEAIKLMPVYKALIDCRLTVLLCATSQHRDMLAQVYDVFGIYPSINLDIMREQQDLFYVHQAVLMRMKEVIAKHNPWLVMVHGDTTTTLATALAAFYAQVPIAHVEAGLRTGTMQTPFPEEMNRKVVSQIATYHFAPTASAMANLLAENVLRSRVFLTGNTVVDALQFMQAKISADTGLVSDEMRSRVVGMQTKYRYFVLCTAHRREAFYGGLERIFNAIARCAQIYPDVYFYFPMHPNPQVHKAFVQSSMPACSNIAVSPACSYIDLVYFLMHSSWIITDSGGLQEEAIALGRSVICVRDVTERIEGVWEGITHLVGTDVKKIVAAFETLYANGKLHTAQSIYGDGRASMRIAAILQDIQLCVNTSAILLSQEGECGKSKSEISKL